MLVIISVIELPNLLGLYHPLPYGAWQTEGKQMVSSCPRGQEAKYVPLNCCFEANFE
jgi:hypothetical protein